MILSNKRVTKVLISLHGCAGWFKFLLFSNARRQVSHVEAQLNPCIRETPKRVLQQTVKTQMKCSIILHFIRVYIVVKDLQTKENNIYTPGKLCLWWSLWWVYCFHVVRLCVRPSVHPSVTFCFLKILKSHCWIFIKPYKNVHICKTNTLDTKVRARGQFYQSYFPL